MWNGGRGLARTARGSSATLLLCMFLLADKRGLLALRVIGM